MMGSIWQTVGSEIPVSIVLGQVEGTQGSGNAGPTGGETVTGQPDPGGTGATGQPAVGGGAAAQPSSMNPLLYLLPILGLFVFMMWTSSSSQKKEKRRREEMLGNLQRHDKVQTIGGVIGSVIEVKDGEVVLKVDESNNIKMRFARSAIQTVLSDGVEDAT